MYTPSKDWNPKQSRLREIINDPTHFDEAIELCLSLHAFVHLSHISGSKQRTLADMVYEDLNENDYSVMPGIKDVTIAWNLWHVARIEDITMNLLVNAGSQVLDERWQQQLNTSVTDTGNAMTDDEIISLSKELDKGALWDYRTAVATRSRDIVRALQPPDLRRTFSQEQTDRITLQRCLTAHPDSIWLKDFWGRKNVAGILLMPLTRHQAGHLNDCLKLKQKFRPKPR